MDKFINYLILLSFCDVITKLISIILFIKRLHEISKKNEVNPMLSFSFLDNNNTHQNKTRKWSKILLFKFSINIILMIISFSMGIIFFIDTDSCSKIFDYENYNYLRYIIIFYFLFEGIIWLFSSILYYKEACFYRNQSWNGLRFFWFSNGIFTLIKIVTIGFIIYINKNIFWINYILFGHFIFSIILLYYSIFRPFDFAFQNLESLNNNQNENKEINAELNTISNDDSILDYNENIDLDDYSEEDIYYDININKDNPLKINFFLRIKTYDFSNFIFIIFINNNKYIKQKLPSEVCNFFEKLIKCYKNKKYENNVINLVQQSYNISLTSNPQKNSFIGKKESLNTLTHLCNETIKISNNYLLDILLFLNLEEINLAKLLKNNNIISVLEEFDDIKEDNLYNEDSINDISKRKTLNNINTNILGNNNLSINDKKLILNNAHQISRDIIKLYTFFNNILINEYFITAKIVKYNEQSSKIECILKTNNQNKEVVININGENLINIIYDDELRTYYIDNINTMIENNEFSIFELLLNDYLNTLIYYDENLFKEFQLNKILNLDVEKFNEDLLINFFENENLECANDIKNISFETILSPLNKNILDNYNNNLFNIKFKLKGVNKKNIINENNKEINIDLNLIKLYITIDNILPVINSYLKKNFNKIYISLNEIKIYIENYIEILLNIDAEGIKKIKIKCENEINKIKYQKSLFGDKKINEFTSLMEKKLVKDNNNLKLENTNIEKLNEKIKEINKSINTILNNNNLKYILFFYSIRKILGIYKLF